MRSGLMILTMLASCGSYAEQVIPRAKLVNTIYLSAKLGQIQEHLQVVFIKDDCSFAGGAVLNSANHRADIKLKTKKCGEIEAAIDGMVAAIDGKLGLQLTCSDVYRNSIGNKVCSKGHVNESTLATIIEF
jgi:hypothetical protein